MRVIRVPSTAAKLSMQFTSTNYPKELIGIRGVAAVCVLLNHSLASLPPSYLSEVLLKGYSVKLFMIVSGFSIYWLLDTHQLGYFRFVVGRVFKIFPVYIVGLLVSVFTLDFAWQTFVDAPRTYFSSIMIQNIQEIQFHFAQHVLANLALLQGVIPERLLSSANSSVVPQAWSLSVEWQLYLVAPFVIAWVSTLWRRTSQICLLGLVGGLLWSSTYLTFVFLGSHVDTISIGIVSYALVRRFQGRSNDKSLSLCMVGLLCVTALCDSNILPSATIWVATVYSFTGLQRGRFAILLSRALCLRFPQYIGRISYSFYIFHMIALLLCLRILERIGFHDSSRYVILPIMSFALTIVIAELANRYIERPFHKIGKSLQLARKRQFAVIDGASLYLGRTKNVCA